MTPSAFLRKHGASAALLAVALGLGAYVWLDRDKVSDGERALRPHNVFPAFRRDEVDRIELVKDQKELVLARDRGKDGGDAAWRIEKPDSLAAEADAVDKLLGILEFATYIRKVDSEAKVAFDSPRLRGSLSMGKVKFSFVLGAAAPSPDGAAYLRVEGEGDYVVSKELVTALLEGESNYRSRNIVPYLSIDLRRLEISGGAEAWSIDRVDEVVFRLDDPKLRASREDLDKVWMAFADMRADGFLGEDEAKAATAHPAFSIKMFPKDASKPIGELLVGGPCPALPDDVVVRRTSPTPLAACVPKLVLEGLATPKKTLVDTKLFVARPDEAEEVMLEPLDGKGPKIEMARKGTGWHVRSPFDRDLASDEADMANALVGALTRGHGDGVVATDPKAKFTPHSKASVVRFENQGTEVVEVGTDEKGNWVAHRTMDGATLALGPELVRRLKPTEIALRGRTVLATKLDPKEVKALSLRCGTEQDLARSAAGNFGFAAPAGYVADSAQALDLVDAMTRIAADAWIADTDDGTFGLATSTCKLQMLGESRLVTVVFGREGEGGVYAQVEDGKTKSPVFLTTKPVRDSAARILLDRSAVSLDPAKLDALVLSSPKARLEFETRAGKLLAKDASVPGGEEALLSSVGAIRADDVAHLGKAEADEGFDAPSLEIDGTVRGDGGPRRLHLTFGRATVRHNQPMYFARIEGISATYLVARERVDAILGGF